MEFPQTFRRDQPEQDPSEKQSRKRVSAAYDLIMVEEGEIEGLYPKKEELRKIHDQIQEKASSVLAFTFKWEEIEEVNSSMGDSLKQRAMEVELKEKSVMERFLELEKKEERLRLRERAVGLIEPSIFERFPEKEKDPDLKQFLDAYVMRLVFEMQNEQVVTQFNTQKELLASMIKKHEEILRELEARKEEVALLSKSIHDKSCALDMKVKEFDLKQTAETERRRKESELVETSLKQLEAKENELNLLNDTIQQKATELEKKEEHLQLKQLAEARGVEAKTKFLELKEKKLEEREIELDLTQRGSEERPIQADTRKRCMLESGPSFLAEKVKDAASLIPPGKKHKPIREHNHNGEHKAVAPISDAHEGESEEAVSVDGNDEDPEPFMCVDSEFNDFSKTMHSFVAGQVWALYDGIDAMPRLYGRIKKVTKSRSSLHLTWFEPKDNESEPVACGRFKWGITETIKTHLTFSHVMHPIIHGKNFIAVIPRKGETWALFRDWSKSWNNNPEQHKLPYRYDFVEVLLNLDDCLGIGVAYLGKVEGFVSVYKQAGQHGVVSLMVTPEEMRRFSHRVPSFRMNGKEKEGVPAGSFELDPAAIPSSILMHDHSIRKEIEETEQQSEDGGKTGEVEGHEKSSLVS